MTVRSRVTSTKGASVRDSESSIFHLMVYIFAKVLSEVKTVSPPVLPSKAVKGTMFVAYNYHTSVSVFFK